VHTPHRRSLSLWGFGLSSRPSPTPSAALRDTASPYNATNADILAEASSKPFASTSASSPEVPKLSSASPTPATPLEPEHSSIIDAADSIIVNGDHLGDLSALGLTGWTSLPGLVRVTMEHLHVTVGLPWWGTILGITLIGRLIAIPFMRKNNINATGMAEIQPQLTKYMESLKAAKRTGDIVEQGNMQTRITTLLKEKDVHPLRSLPSAGIQMLTGIMIFLAIRKMCLVPVASMATGGILTFPDLTVPDPTYILPAVAVVATIGSARVCIFRIVDPNPH
jgi:YidC/Oxa1 family membrane protein insertase